MKQAEARGPYILAIETATMIGSIALFAGSQLVGSVEIRRAKSHARLLMPMIEQLLDQLEIAPTQLEAIAVGKGPGSYTGLRVGVSTAKGLCMALDKPLLSFGSLEALAWQVKELATELEAWICPLIDARRMEVYAAFFDAGLDPQSAIKAVILENGVFEEVLAERRVIFLGDGVAKAKELLGASPHAIVLSESLSRASSVGKLLHQKYGQQAFEDLVTFEPFYLKDFVATKSRKWAWLKK
jgi:tRNA threonylcarbamoyladenosine biosynthesis protein TsaB